MLPCYQYNNIDYSKLSSGLDYLEYNHVEPFYRYIVNICADIHLNQDPCGANVMICEQLEVSDVWNPTFVCTCFWNDQSGDSAAFVPLHRLYLIVVHADGYTDQFVLQAGAGSVVAVGKTVGQLHPTDGVDR